MWEVGYGMCNQNNKDDRGRRVELPGLMRVDNSKPHQTSQRTLTCVTAPTRGFLQYAGAIKMAP